MRYPLTTAHDGARSRGPGAVRSTGGPRPLGKIFDTTTATFVYELPCSDGPGVALVGPQCCPDNTVNASSVRRSDARSVSVIVRSR